MAFNVQVISVETIKPNSPTPKHLSSHKLCRLDRMSPPFYGSTVFFFTSTPENSLDKVHDHLKSSLSITMTQFYPLAGRLQGGNNFSINCNDEGVSYISALASIGLPGLSNRQIQLTQLVKLLPSHLHERSLDLADQLLLGVQVTSFSCGGVAIGVSIWHQVADAATLVSFLKTWSEICGGQDGTNAVLTNSIVTDCSSIFPLSDKLEIFPNVVGTSLDDLSTNRLFFDSSRIASLREKIGAGMEADQLPTRFEALAALIWGAAIATVNQEKLFLTPSGKFRYSMISVEMRKKVNPPLPQHCIGNIIYPAIEKWEMDRPVDYPELARKVRHSIKIVDHEYVLNQPPDVNPFFDLVKDSAGNVSYFSSLCRFPFYEIDLGFGKPSWIHPFAAAKGTTVFVDARDGDGIEALVTFSKQDMVKFEQDPGIIEYAKFSPTPC